MADTPSGLYRMLADPDPYARLDAAIHFAQSGHFDAIEPVFAELLADEDPDLRAEAAHKLGWIGPLWSANLLGPLGTDADVEVRHDAIFALSETCRIAGVRWL